jgi:hypothetical protein
MLDHPVEEGVHWFMGKVWPLKDGQVCGFSAGWVLSIMCLFLFAAAAFTFIFISSSRCGGFQAKSNRCGFRSLYISAYLRYADTLGWGSDGLRLGESNCNVCPLLDH